MRFIKKSWKFNVTTIQIEILVFLSRFDELISWAWKVNILCPKPFLYKIHRINNTLSNYYYQGIQPCVWYWITVYKSKRLLFLENYHFKTVIFRLLKCESHCWMVRLKLRLLMLAKWRNDWPLYHMAPH